MIRVFSAQERPGAAFRGTPSPDNVRQDVTAGSRSVGRGGEVWVTTTNMHVGRSHSTNIIQGREPREVAVCLRASANNFAETIGSVALRRYSTLFYPILR